MFSEKKKEKKVAKNIHRWTISHKSVKYCLVADYNITLFLSDIPYFSARDHRGVYPVISLYFVNITLIWFSYIFFLIERNFAFLFLWSQAQQIVSCCREKGVKSLCGHWICYSSAVVQTGHCDMPLVDCCQTHRKLGQFCVWCFSLAVHKLDLVPSKLLPECIKMYR